MVEQLSPRVDVGVTHSDALPAGTRLGEFELQRLLAVGGFGMVYQAFDHSLQRQVAIKEYMPSALVGRGSTKSLLVRANASAESYYAGLKSFMTEARLLAQFDHPSLVKVFRFWEENNTAYMVMPLYSGMTLAQACKWMRQPPTESWLRKVLWSILGGLKLLHEADVVHRDVTPDNIFLQDTGAPVLLDLGAARRAIPDPSQQMTAILKVNYAPVEQYAEDSHMQQGPWTDLYSLSAVMHTVLSKEAPLPATFRLMKDRMRPFADVVRQVEADTGQTYSPAFTKTIAKCLSIRPKGRLQSVDAFMQAMQLRPPVMSMALFDWRASCVLLPDPNNPQASSTAQERTVLIGSEGVTSSDMVTAPLEGRGHMASANDAQGEPASAGAGAQGLASASQPAVLRGPLAAAKPFSKPAASPGWTRWAALASVLLVFGGLAWWGLAQNGHDSGAVAAVAAPPPPAAPAAVAPEPALAPAAAPESVVAVAASEPAASAPVAAGPAVVPVAATVAPATAPAPAQATSTAARKAVVASANRRQQRNTDSRSQVRVIEEPAPAPVVVPPPVAVAAPAPPVPRGLCAEVSPANRGNCFQRECQKSEHRQHAACVALRTRDRELYR